jgi:hypothetical protein
MTSIVVRASWMIAVVLLGLGAACARPSELCDGDQTCNPGRRCVMGRCRSALDVASSPPSRDADAGEVEAGAQDAAGDSDASDAACADDGAECDWRPERLAGLVLWLDAANGVTAGTDGLVSWWRDLSGQGNHAFQDDPLLRPTLTTDLALGRSAVAFRTPQGRLGAHLRIADAATMRWGFEDFAFFVVASATSVGNARGQLWSKVVAPSAVGLQLHAAGRRLAAVLKPGLAPYETASEGFTDGGLFAFGLRRRQGSVLDLRANGAANGRITGADVAVDLSAAGAPALLGVDAEGTAACCPLQGSIAEVIAVRGQLPEEDLARIEGYLRRKHRLPALR